ncbi:MAG: DUF6541 family protein [Patescibacteria group bacterium]
MVFIFLILFFIQYYAPIRGRYVVPPGDDPYSHYLFLKPILDGQSNFIDALKLGAYPPGFHFIIAKIAESTHTDPLRIMVLIYPLIFLLISLVVFIFSYLIFGRKVALIAFLLYGFTQNAHLQLQNDGGYPNLIAAGIFLPLLILSVIYFFKKDGLLHKLLFLILSLILAAGIFVTHHLSAIYLLGLFLTSFPVLIIYLWISNRWSYVKGLVYFLLYAGILCLTFYMYQYSEMFASERNLSNMMVQLLNNYPFLRVIPREESSVLPLYLYDDNLVKIIFIIGLMGIPYAFYCFKENHKKLYFPLLLLTTWAIMLFIVSRMSFLSDPGRAMRDLTIPLVIFSAIFLSDILNRFKDKVFAVAILFVCAYFWLWGSVFQRFISARSFEPMVRITDADIDAIKTIKNTPGKNKRILTNVSHPWLNYYLSDYNINYTQDYIRDIDLISYDFVYQIDNQMGWSSTPINYKFTKNISNGELKILGQYSTPTNNINVYEVIK